MLYAATADIADMLCELCRESIRFLSQAGCYLLWVGVVLLLIWRMGVHVLSVLR